MTPLIAKYQAPINYNIQNEFYKQKYFGEIDNFLGGI